MTEIEEKYAALWDEAAELAAKRGCHPDRDVECWDECVAIAYSDLKLGLA